ncbi:MAG: Uncharacterized protein G01um101416_814 [Microgenomates group bacterium Gr01-1014_16]|nr:MAG: Uncharacterized protein G01um101416_814 [Microgenomates group bacterium Gr01-1014_16]
MKDQCQREYFDLSKHRFDQTNLINPPFFQQLELNQLYHALNLSPKSSLIDFGAGSGRVSIFFLKLGFNVLAVDISPKSLIDLSKYYKKYRQPSWGKLTLSSELPNRPVAHGIVGADVLHHIPIPEYLPIFQKSLLPGGHLAFSEPNAWHLPWYIHYLISGIPWSVEEGILQCTLPNLRSRLQIAGFSNIKITGHGLLPTRFFTRFPALCQGNVIAAKLAPPLAFRFIISCSS